MLTMNPAPNGMAIECRVVDLLIDKVFDPEIAGRHLHMLSTGCAQGTLVPYLAEGE